MVKVKKGTKQKALAAKQKAKEEAKPAHVPVKKITERQTLKLAKKAKFLKKIANSASGGIKKKVSAKRKALPDLATLGEALQEAQKQRQEQKELQAGAKPLGSAVHSAKARLKIGEEESARMKQVLKHPLYKVDPIKAITNHLNNTLPPPPTAQAKQAAQAARPKKKKKNKDQSDMEM